MDNIKLYAKSEWDFDFMTHIRSYSEDIRVLLRLHKCGIILANTEKVIRTVEVKVLQGRRVGICDSMSTPECKFKLTATAKFLDPSLVMPSWKNKLDTGGIDATDKDPECTVSGNLQSPAPQDSKCNQKDGRQR